MGSGASMQAEQPRQRSKPNGEKEEGNDANRKNQRKKTEIVITHASAIPGSITSHAIKKPEWRDALKNKDLSHFLHRKMKAAALGRKSACKVEIKRTGFTFQHIKICEGQVVTFHWNDTENKGYNVIQVVHDGEKYREVVGGFHSGKVIRKGMFEQQFNMAGEYTFTSAGVKCEPLVIEVDPRRDVEAIVSDAGFEPHLIRLDEGNAVKWTWNDCEVPHTITEATFNLKDLTLKPVASDKAIPTKTGSFRKEFNKPGLYYFQTRGLSPTEKKTCIVHVRERQREYKIDVCDNAFKPQILLIEEGDRVWWDWSKNKCLKPHCIYEAQLPKTGALSSEEFKQKKNGFKWHSPSKSGLMSHEFFKAGVYYYSDRGFNEAAEYIGTIIVKPAVVDHFIELTKGGFIPDMSHVKTGDRIWWTWLTSDFDQGSVVEEIEKCISPEGPGSTKQEPGGGTKISKELQGQKFDAGLELAEPATVGVYHFYNHDTDSVCSLICNGGPKNHTIHVTDGGFEPSRITVHKGDRVWWIWQDGKKQHNITQTSHKGRVINEGFHSGAPLAAPSAFMHQFQEPGLYYYISNGTGKTIGTILVRSQSQVHEIDVKPAGIDPDPKVIKLNDVVAWNFEDLVESDVKEVITDADIKEAESKPLPIIPRGCLNRVFPNKGVFHYGGTAFAKPSQEAIFMDGHRISTIIVDSNNDSAPVTVDDQGFHPKEISIAKGKSIKWCWDGCRVPHNIMHIKRPLNGALANAGALNEVQGDKAFISGPVAPSGNFMHTFDEPGVYFVASEGAPSHPGIVTVTSDEDAKTQMPWIASEKNGGVVEKSHKVQLCCDDPNALLFYTTDGSEPALHSPTTIPYNPQKGIELCNPGLKFIRAVAVSPDVPCSDVLTSKRFWVLGNENEELAKPEEEQSAIQEPDMADKLNWEKCTPEIKASFTEPGTMKVTWDTLPKQFRQLLAGYQLLLNGVSYSKMLKPRQNCATVTGLAGGRTYDVQLVACPKDRSLSPLGSDILTMTSTKSVESQGPLISLETTAKPDTMSIVWMSLNSSTNPIEGYRIYLNGHMCGNMIVPDATSNRCRVVIEGCNTGVLYKVKVAAIPPGGSPPKMSNELEVTLPLNVENIHVPEGEAERNETNEEDGKYSEFLTVKEDPAHEEKEIEAQRLAREGKVNIEVKDDEDQKTDPNALPLADKSTSTAVMTVTPVLDSAGHLPVPVVMAEKKGDDAVCVSWKYPSSAEPMYHLVVSVVNVIGQKFRKNINSDISFECMHDDNGNAVPAVQHTWNVTKDNSCIVKGLARGTTYSIYVVANYALANTKHSYEVQTKSLPIMYTTPPTTQMSSLKVLSLDPNKVTIGLENVRGESVQDPDPDVIGYQLLVDGQPVGRVINRSAPQATLDKLQPGKTVKASIAPVTIHGVNPAEISNPLKICCPKRPAQPIIKEQPAYKRGSAMVAWENSSASEPTSRGDDVIFYRVYLDGKLHGEVKANAAGNRNGYQYFLTDLTPGKTYDVSIKAFAGQLKIDPNSDQVFCLTESNLSNSIPITCPAPPESPQLRVEGMNSSGLEVSWDMPQQHGEATVSGYQMLKDGKLYGSIIPPDVHSLRLKGLTLGEKVDLQILALTDHAVGRDGDKTLDDQGPSEIFIGDRYSACRPGPKLVVHYTGLVEAPSKVWCEQVTGQSAMIVWSKETEPKEHFVPPDVYQVTWWPGKQAEADIQSQSTKDDHMLISGLQPNTPYTFVVEARKMKKYSDISEEGSIPEDGYNNTFIMTAQSEHLHVQTTSPPLPPSNLGVLATTCNSVQLSWDPLKEGGTDIIGIRIDAIDMNSEDKKIHSSVEVAPDATSATLENLQEKTDYLITVTAITSEFFNQAGNSQDPKQSQALSKNHPVPDDTWLPTTSIIVKTSGTEAPIDIRVVQTTPESVTLEWEPARVHGSNRLQGTVVRWMEFKPGQPSSGNEAVLAHHRSVQADANRVMIDGLEAGVMYKFVVEAVVSVKTTLDVGKSTDVEAERMNRRTTHVMSKPIVARTRAPCEPPRPIITAFTTTTVNVYWEKPLMHLVTGKDIEGKPKHLKLSLQGYRLEVNGKPHMRLSPEAQSCTLIKCKPGKTYKIVLVALTCTAEANRMRKKQKASSNGSMQSPRMNQEWKQLPEDFDNDESPSEPLSATLPNLGNGLLGEENVQYVMPPEKLNTDSSKDEPGHVLVQWQTQGDSSNIRQYNVTWKNLFDGSVQHRCLDPDVGKLTIPVTHRKAVYDIAVEPKYDKDIVPVHIQHVQVLVPGPPDPPEIWIKSVDDNEFVIEWSEPRLYGTRLGGYQVYVNEKKVGNPLSSHHRKAVIPCKPNRQYKINLVALSSDHRISDSDQSNTLLVNTGSTADTSIEYALDMDDSNDTMTMSDENELRLHVVRIEDSSIHLDWTEYQETSQNIYYRVVWSSSAQPSEREVRLPAGEKSCVLHKCYPGTNHYVRLFAVGADDTTLDKSRQLTIQTSAAPEPPTVSTRAVNFNYLAIQWEKPKTYGDAAVAGYKIFANGVVEAVLGPDQFSYSFTHGQWCHEYVFQVQAVTNVEKLASRLSDPLVLVWPGVLPPLLVQSPPNTADTVKIVWDAPYTTEGVKIKQLKMIVMEEETERVIQNISPIHPDKEEVEIHNLKQGEYLVYLEVYIHGTPEIVRSDTIKVSPTVLPDPPQVTVSVTGMEERRLLEKRACDLFNIRDRLMNTVNSKDFDSTYDEQAIIKAAYRLTLIEEMLDDCLMTLTQNYTGHMFVEISWTCPQRNPSIQITGYKLLVDGKQYGDTLRASVRTIRIKLGVGRKNHRVGLVCVCEKPPATSTQSNVVEVLTDPFLPFSVFSFLNQAPRSGRFRENCLETLSVERKFMSRRPINQGLMARKTAASPPQCSVMDILKGEIRPLMPSSGDPYPTAILFWSTWCQYSKKFLSWFVKFAKASNTECNCIAVACDSNQAGETDWQKLAEAITELGCQTNSIHHVTSQTVTAASIKTAAASSSDLCELFGVVGLPTLVIVHPQNYVAWRGRYYAFDYEAFEHFMDYVLAQVMGRNGLPHPDPWEPELDIEMPPGGKKRLTNREVLSHQPSTYSGAMRSGAVQWRSLSAKQNVNSSTKKPKKEEITVSARPFSASRSPYEQKMDRFGSAVQRSRKAKSNF